MQTSNTADGAMSTIFNNMRSDGCNHNGQHQHTCGHATNNNHNNNNSSAGGDMNSSLTQGLLGQGNGASSSTGSALEPRLSDTSFGLGVRCS